MAIQQLQIPSSGINNTVDQAQWSQLAGLGDVYQKAQAQARQQAALASLGTDPQANMRTLLTSQDPQLAQAGLNLQQKSIEAQREDAANAQKQANWQQNFALLKQEAERKNMSVSEVVQERKDAWVANGGKPEGADYQAYLFNGALPDRTKLSAGGLTAIPLLEDDPNNPGQKRPAIGQLTQSGDVLKSRLPQGTEYAGQNEKVETPTETLIRDRSTNQIIARYPKDVAGAAAQKVEGTAQGKAVVDLPKTEADAKLVTDTIDKALAPHPGKSWSVGTIFKDVPALPGSETANYRAVLDQLNSQTFLEAYNSLKGGGAISNYEDKRASAAKARLSTAQSVEAFDDALREYKEIVQHGVERMRGLAGKQAPAAPASTATRPPLGSIFK